MKKIVIGLLLLFMCLNVVCASEDINETNVYQNVLKLDNQNEIIQSDELQADFDSDIKENSDNITATFTDTSAGNPTAWFWDFGDGTNDTLQNPIHTYTKYGLYDVKLTVSTETDNNSITKYNLVEFCSSPKEVIINPSFENGLNGWETSGTVTTATTGTNVNQGSASCQLSANAVISQMINFDTIDSISFYVKAMGNNLKIISLIDGVENNQFSTKRNTWVQITVDVSNIRGNHNFGLKNGVAQTYIDNIVVNYNNNTYANFGIGEYNVDNVVSISFLDESLGFISKWFWDFGDGTNSTEQNPTHIFSNPGKYNVTLNVSNKHNSTIIKKELVIGKLSNANFTNNETIGVESLTVQFNDITDGIVGSWFWDFGDGTNSTEQNPIHTYSQLGEYDVTLIVSNSLNSSTVKKEKLILVVNKISPKYAVHVYTGTPVFFTDLSEGNPISWFWDFGDGTNSTEQNTTHTFEKSGKYNVILNASNPYSSGTIAYVVYVHNSLKASIDFSADSGYFNAESSIGDINSYFWDFGDGTNSTKVMGYHPFTDYGTYYVTLTVSDNYTSNSITKVVNFYSKNYYVEEFNSFENSTDGWTFSEGTEIRSDNTETVQFYNNGKYSVFISNTNEYMEKEVNFDNIDYFKFDAIANPNLGGPQSFAIYIDDNLLFSTSAEARSWKNIPDDTATPNILDTSNLNGVHKLKVQSTGGYNIYIDSFEFGSYNHYLADFTTSITKIKGDEITVAFKDASYGTINSWLWNFNDGTTSTEQNPTHTFSKGEHSVSLTIYRDGIKMASVTNYLNLALPTIASTGEAYATIQDAINAAGENDVIDIPDIGVVFSENILINKTLTLNFNGVTLNAKDANQALLNVTNGANVIVNNIDIGKNAILATTTDSTLNIIDSAINVNLALNEGNINLLDDSFTNSIIAVLANVNINNAEFTNGAVVVNGGKSKIFNTTLTGSNIAITQTAGELDIISNLITDNNIGVNVTGGKTNMEYNLIYANDKFGLVYVGNNVGINNNWWGSDEPLRANGETLSDSYWDIYRLEVDGVDEFSYLILKFTTSESVMGTNKEYKVNIETVNDDGEKVTGYIKNIDLEITSSQNTYYATLENGNAEITITTPDNKADNIPLTVLGTDYLINVPVMDKTNLLISVEGEAVVNGSVVVNVEVPYATGNVKFYVDDDIKTVELNNTQASYIISNLTSGKHNIFAVYEGNEIFNSIYNSTSIEVPESEDYNKTISDLKTQLEEAQNNATNLANELEKSKDNTTNLINSLNDANKQVENLTTQLSEAQDNATKLTNSLADANNKADNLTAQLSEAQKTIKSLSSDLISTTISANNLAIKASDNGNIQVTLKDANNNLLANKSVQVIINGVSYKGTTNNNGIASITVKYATAGTYNAVVSFIGDDTYKGSIGTSKVTVSKKATTLTAKKATLKVKKAKKIKVTLKSGGKAIAGKTITIKVNKKTFKAKTNKKGVATIKVKVAKKGNFKAVVKFAGDSAYKAITKKIKLTVKK